MPPANVGRAGFLLARPGPDCGSIDLRNVPDASAAFVEAVVREIRLRSFGTVNVVVGSRAGLSAVASIARRLPAVTFALTIRGCLPDAGPAAALPNVVAAE